MIDGGDNFRRKGRAKGTYVTARRDIHLAGSSSGRYSGEDFSISPFSQPKGGAMDKLYGGIDLHANNSMVVVLDEQEQVRYHQRLPNLA